MIWIFQGFMLLKVLKTYLFWEALVFHPNYSLGEKALALHFAFVWGPARR